MADDHGGESHDNFIFQVVRILGTAFDFQLFNPYSKSEACATETKVPGIDQQYVPSTVFVAADHLSNVLLGDLVPRSCANHQVKIQQAFVESVWVLHAKLFRSYSNWAVKQVDLPVRPREDQHLMDLSYSDDAVVKMLMAEISLYMLIYTETANLRHMPEFISLLFWTMRFSPAFSAALSMMQPLSEFTARGDAGISLRMEYEMARNECAAIVDELMRAVVAGSVQPTWGAVEECVKARVDAPLETLDTVVDLILHGDGGSFLDTLVQPMFLLLSYLEDKLGGSQHDTSTRLTYDDCNDSLVDCAVVKRALGLLGAGDMQHYNTAFAALQRMGRSADGKHFDPRVAAEWWEREVFQKVFVERRGWLHVYRNNSATLTTFVMCIQSVVIFTLVAFNFNRQNFCRNVTKGDCSAFGTDGNNCRWCVDLAWVGWSSLVVSHCFFAVVHKWANWYLSQQPYKAPPLSSIPKGDIHLRTPWTLEAPTAMAANRPPVPDIPKPHVIRDGHVAFAASHYVLGFLLLLMVYIGQFNPGNLGYTMSKLWIAIATLYILFWVLRTTIVVRDGYRRPCGPTCANMLCPPEAQFCSGDMTQKTEDRSRLKVGWSSFMRNTMLWVLTLLATLLAIYCEAYQILRWVVVWALKDYTVEQRGTWTVGSYDTGLPTPNYQIVIALMMVVTAFLSVLPFMTFIDIVAGTQLLSSMIGVRHGFAVAKNWAAFAKNFDNAAELFCFKCLPRPVAITREPVKSFSVIWNAIVMDFWSRDLIGIEEAHNLSYLEIPDNDLTAAMDLPEVFPPPFSLGPHLTNKIQQPLLPFLTPKQSVTRDASKILSLIMWILADLDLLNTTHAAEISRLMAAAADEPTTRSRVNNLAHLVLSWAKTIAPCLPATMPNAHTNAATSVASASSIHSTIHSFDSHPSSTVPSMAGIPPAHPHAPSTPATAPRHPSLTASRAGSFSRANLHQSLDGGLTDSVILAPGGRAASITGRIASVTGRHGSATAAARAASLTRRPTAAALQGGPAPGGASNANTISVGFGVGQGSPKEQARKAGAKSRSMLDRVEVAGGLEEVLRELRNVLGQWERQTEYGQLSRALFRELDAALATAGSATSLARAHSQLTSALVPSPTLISSIKYLGCVAKCTNWACSEPRSKEAEWLLRLFMKSLHNPKLGRKPACHVATMPSLTTLIPLYNEDISMAYDATEATVQMLAAHNLSGMTKSVDGNHVVTLPDVPKIDPLAPKDTSRVWLGCMEEVEPGVSQASHLIRTFASDWDNFRSRIALMYSLALEEVRPAAFAAGAPLHHLQQEFCEWVSARTQMLSRHLRGLACSAVATRVLLRLECPKPEAWSEEDYEHWVEAVVGRKYQVLVAAQTLGDKLRSNKSRDQYNARALLYLLNRYPFMQCAMLKTEPKAFAGKYNQQYSVVIRGSSYFACPEVSPDEHAIGSMSLYRGSVLHQDLQDYEVEYCMRLPVNPFTARGIIIGEGKAENHNSAMPFITSELLQGNDMNMDNILSEAFKLRNLVSDAMARDPLARMFPRLRALKAESDDDSDEVHTPHLALPSSTNAQDLNSMLHLTLSGPQLAIIGMTSWICTAYSSPISQLNNYLEIIFVFNIQRYMQYASRVRYHYGYADVWNKFWAMTTTGLSRPVRNVNVVEDLTVGVRVALKGGVIKHRDYIMSGKGRETNLMGIYSYHRKIGAGVMEATFGRDFFRLHRIHDLFRQSTSYMFMNNTCVTMHVVFAAAIARLLTYYIVTLFELDPAQSKTQGNMMAHMPMWFPQISMMKSFYLFLTLFWAVFLVLVLFGPEEYIQNGWRGLGRMIVNLTLRGYVMFSMLILKIWEFFGVSATKYMAGKYIATGRGMGLHHIQFTQLFIFWARGFWTYSAVITLMALAHHYNPNTNVSPVVLPWYASSITFPLLLAAFLVFGPSWYTPLALHPRRLLAGAHDWVHWMWAGAKDRATSLTWAAFNDDRAGHYYNANGRVADYWITWVGCLSVLALRASVTAAYSLKVITIYIHQAGRPTSGGDSVWQSLDNTLFSWLPVGTRTGDQSNFQNELANMAGRTLVFWGVLLLVLGPLSQLLLKTRLSRSRYATLAGVTLIHVLAFLAFLQVHYRFLLRGYMGRCLFLLGVWHVNIGELLALAAIPLPLRIVRHAVTSAYWLGDYLLGVAVLGAQMILSAPMIFHWAQCKLIFTGSGYSEGC